MATNWPNSVQTFTNPSAGDSLNSPSHSAQHSTVNDTVVALQQHAGLVFIKSVTIGSGVSSVTVSNAFSADFQNYKILIDVANCTGDAALMMKVGSTTSGYYGGHYGYRFNGVSYSFFANNGAETSIGAVGAGRGGWVVIDINNPFETEETSWAGNFLYRRTTSSGNGAFGYHGSMVDNTTSYTAFTIEPDFVNTMTGGTIRVYGYNNG